MAIKDIDLGSAMRRLADLRIEEAMKQGKFSNLRGKGRDIVLDDMPADENARMTWWCLRILRQNDVLPDEVRWRKQIDGLRERLDQITDENGLVPLVVQINALALRINTLGTNALKAAVVPLHLETERAKLRHRLHV